MGASKNYWVCECTTNAVCQYHGGLQPSLATYHKLPIDIPKDFYGEIPQMDGQELKVGFSVKDSGVREKFDSGMVRDTAEGKTDYTRITDGPMFDRWAEHVTKAEVKYPDIAPGVANWTQANGDKELVRFRKSAFRHFRQWLRGDVDEDHAAAVFFNINGAEFVKAKLQK